MSDLYIQDSNLYLSLSGEKIIIKNEQKELLKEIGMDKVENILIFGNSQLTTQLVKQLSQREINIYYFSMTGKYICTVDSGRKGDFEKQEWQAKAHFNSAFRLEIARKIIGAKVKHQLNLLRAYNDDGILDNADFERFVVALENIEKSKTIHEMMGYEGRIAKSYFYCLNLIVPDNFHFVGRSRRPAKDAFNSLLNLGYHFLYSFMVGMIKKFGLSQGFGMIHESHQHHATLASDLMEEWRAIIVDDTILTLLKNGWITEDDFSLGDEESYLTQEAQKIFLQALASRILEIHAYLKEDTKRYTCLYMLEMQIESFIRACKEGDASLYQEGFTGDVDGKLL